MPARERAPGGGHACGRTSRSGCPRTGGKSPGRGAFDWFRCLCGVSSTSEVGRTKKNQGAARTKKRSHAAHKDDQKGISTVKAVGRHGTKCRPIDISARAFSGQEQGGVASHRSHLLEELWSPQSLTIATSFDRFRDGFRSFHAAVGCSSHSHNQTNPYVLGVFFVFPNDPKWMPSQQMPGVLRRGLAPRYRGRTRASKHHRHDAERMRATPPPPAPHRSYVLVCGIIGQDLFSIHT